MNHTIAIYRYRYRFFLSPDLGQEGFRLAGPFVPPTFHHLKIETENLELQHTFLAKTRMHEHRSIYSTACFSFQSLSYRDGKDLSSEKRFATIQAFKFWFINLNFLVVIQNARDTAIPGIIQIPTETRFPVAKTFVNWLVTFRLMLCDLWRKVSQAQRLNREECASDHAIRQRPCV